MPAESERQATSPAGRPLFLFVHLMKTAGTTFRTSFGRLFPTDEVWPPLDRRDGGADAPDASSVTMMYSSLTPLAELVARRPTHLSFIAGHFPFSAGDLVQPLTEAGPAVPARELVRLTLLREPVARTVSFLAHTRRHEPQLRDRPLEAVYEDPWLFDRFVRDHQTRVLSMTVDEATALRTDQVFLAEVIEAMAVASGLGPEGRAEVDRLLGDRRFGVDVHATLFDDLVRAGVDMETRPEVERRLRAEPRHHVPEAGVRYLAVDAAVTRPSPVDDDRLAVARRNLERCAVVGTTEEYARFVEQVNRTYGLECPTAGRRNAGDVAADEISASFRRRIEADNRHDLELYERARALIRAGR